MLSTVLGIIVFVSLITIVLSTITLVLLWAGSNINENVSIRYTAIAPKAKTALIVALFAFIIAMIVRMFFTTNIQPFDGTIIDINSKPWD